MTKKTEITIISILFLIFFVIGLFVYDDYGIWVDDRIQRQHGIITYRWINRNFFNRRGAFTDEGTEDLPNYANKYYGVAIQLPLVLAEDVYWHFNDHETMPVHTIYHMRHLYIHCIYLIALFCFYLMMKDLFHSPRAGIAGVLMIYTFGRLFAHSFYNIKDSVFASLFMISLFCAVRAIKTEYSGKWCFRFAVASAFAVSSRIVGALLPALLLVLIIAEHMIKWKKLPYKAILLICMAYPIWLLITPASWTDPINFSIECATKFSDYDGLPNPRVFFGGTVLKQKDVPFDFYLRWIGLTVPLVYLFFSIYGLIVFSVKTMKKTEQDPLQLKSLLIMASVFFIILMYFIIRRPTVYSDWRHIFFVYSLIISFAVFGFESLCENRRKWVKIPATAILVVSILYNSLMMYANHPAEFMAYNPVGQQVANLYQGDYWGMSKLHLLHWIADNESEKQKVSAYPGTKTNRGYLTIDRQMLDDESKEKIRIVKKNAKYLVVWTQRLNFAFGLNPPVIEGYEKVYSVTSYGAEITAVYKRMK